ncbi:MAG: TonB-system energizer ExbB [Deltaproteobacteria bacterium]|nr:TonB-system energizer ExbB [Deltaproteobacteria bacterium]
MDLLQAGIDYGILGLLGVLSIVALALAGERWWRFRTIAVSAFPDKLSMEKSLTRHLHLIATIGSNAPYIGLLGTVLGIMLTFYTMGTGGFMDAPKIMAGIALALKATAAGLLVAIPSVVAYNLLLRKVKVLLMDWEIEHGRKEF